MPARSHRRPIFCVVVLAFGVGGCGEAGSDHTSESPRPTTTLQRVAANAKAVTEATEQAANPETVAAVVATDESDYEPPFPGRADLFAPPKQGSRVAKQRTGDSSASVVLLGFAKLDTPRAVLAIDNRVHPMGEGEEWSGVRVISISPPQAVLQRGRSRWTASIQ